MSPINRKTFSAIAAGTVLAAVGALAAWPADHRPVMAVAETSPSVPARQLAQGILPLYGGGPIQTRISAQDVRAAKTLTHGLTAADGAVPPTTAQCRAQFDAPCFSVQQLARAYSVDDARRAGWTGKGATVVLPIWGAAPEKTLRHDLAMFSAAHGLQPADLEYHATGPIPPMPDPSAPDAPMRYALAQETALDASMIHGMAPAARIVVIAVPGGEGLGGYDAILDAVQHYAKRHPGPIVSMSYGEYESRSTAATLIRLNRRLDRTVRATGATIVAASGDTGNTSGTSPDPAVPWPASSPSVTAVAGTEMHLSDAGDRLAPDTVWDDPNGIGRATGGGLSAAFARPPYQNPYRNLVGRHRGVADVAANGSGKTRVVFYSTFNSLGGQLSRDGGWWRAAGTSVATPLIAGITALARQAAHRPLGTINPALYQLAATPRRAQASGILDVTAGCNSVPGNRGWCASLGWDRVSGVGTVGDARLFVPALVAARRRANAASH